MFVRVTSVVPTSRARENYSNQRACRVRFTPNSDRESGFPHKVMSALPQKADMCGTARDVCFGSKADMCSAKRHVRSYPESGHVQCNSGCPLCANNGHDDKSARFPWIGGSCKPDFGCP